MFIRQMCLTANPKVSSSNMVQSATYSEVKSGEWTCFLRLEAYFHKFEAFIWGCEPENPLNTPMRRGQKLGSKYYLRTYIQLDNNENI